MAALLHAKWAERRGIAVTRAAITMCMVLEWHGRVWVEWNSEVKCQNDARVKLI